MVGQAVVPDHLRTAALGLQALLFRAFGSIPLPVIAAKIIDSKCYWWGTSCMNERGACRAFDKYGMRTRNRSYSHLLNITHRRNIRDPREHRICNDSRKAS